MKFIAAFLWDASEKSISYMIIDENYNKRVNPTSKKLDALDLELFKLEAEKMIANFFQEIRNIYKSDRASSIKIERKIVSYVSPMYQLNTKLYIPTVRTLFVQNKFLELFKQISSEVHSIKLVKQFRSKLVKPALTHFNDGLYNLGIVGKGKNLAYQRRLWALALHATKSDYQKKLHNVFKILMTKKVAKTKKKISRSTKNLYLSKMIH